MSRSSTWFLVGLVVGVIAPCCGEPALADDASEEYGQSRQSWVSIALHAEADTSASVAVSNCALDLGGWRYKAIFGRVEGAFSLNGLFAVRSAAPELDRTIECVWYAAPATDDGEWAAEAFPNMTAAAAAGILKSRFAVPSQQDHLWDVGPLLPSADPCDADSSANALCDGLLVGDSLHPVVSSLDCEAKSMILTALAAAGYPAVESKPQVVGGMIQRQMLNSLRTVFVHWVAAPRVLTMVNHLTGQALAPQTADIELLMSAWDQSGPSEYSPCPPGWTSPWEPVADELCDCATFGPFHNCQQVTFSAEGKVDVVIPWPLPLGTRVTLTGSAHGTTAWSVCGWLRRCTGMAHRTKTQFLPPNCTVVESTELATKTFEHWGWWPVQMMPTCADTSCINSPASGIPPDSEECGLGTGVVPAP